MAPYPISSVLKRYTVYVILCIAGLIEVILFAIPFMLVTNFLVLAAMWRNNVW